MYVDRRLRVHPRGDHQRGEGVPALVEGDRKQLRLLPASDSSLRECDRLERPIACPSEQEPLAASRPEPVSDQQLP